MTERITKQDIRNWIKGTILISTWKPIGLRNFKSWKQYKKYRSEIKRAYDSYNRDWDKAPFSRKDDLILRLNDDFENINAKWRRIIEISKNKVGVKKLKKVA